MLVRIFILANGTGALTYCQPMRTRQELIDDLYGYTDSTRDNYAEGYLPTLLREAAVLLERDRVQIREYDLALALEDVPLEE